MSFRAFRHHVALLSLPRLCGTTRDTVPMMPRLPMPALSNSRKLRIQRQPFALHIGLVWASGADNKDMYVDKSIALEPLMQLFDRWRQERLLSSIRFRWVLMPNNLSLGALSAALWTFRADW